MSDAPPPPSYDSLFGGSSGGLNGQANGISSHHNGDSSRHPHATAPPPAFNPGFTVAGPASSQPTYYSAATGNGYVPYGASTSSTSGNAPQSHIMPYPTSAPTAFPSVAAGMQPAVQQHLESQQHRTGGSSSWWPFGGGGKTPQQADTAVSYKQAGGGGATASHRPYQPFGSTSASSSSLNRPSAASQQHPPPLQHHPFAAVHYSNEEEDELRGLFSAVDEDGDGHITIPELQSALLNDNWTPFKTATVRMLLRMFDQDVNDTIEFNEFRDMKSYVQQFQRIFDTYDADRSGTIDAQEVRQALAGMSFVVSEQFCQFLCSQFKQSRAAAAVNLDTFIQICATIKHATAQFESNSANARANQPAYERFLRAQLQQLC